MAPSREIEKLQRRWQENPLGLTFAPLAEAYRKEGMFADALELLELGLIQHPSYVPAHIVKGRCYLDTRADPDAERAFVRVADLDPENVIALKSLAEIAERSGRFEDAIQRLERLLEFDRGNEDARLQLDQLLINRQVQTTDQPGASWPPMPEEAAGPGGTALPASDQEPPADEIPLAGIVDEASADVEVTVFSPVELTAQQTSEFQELGHSESLLAEAAHGEPGSGLGLPGGDEVLVPEPTEQELSAEPSGGNEAPFVEPLVAAEVAEPVTATPIAPEEEPAPELAEPEPTLVVTETMAEVFLRQGHRELALAVYGQLATREPENVRIREAIGRLEAEMGSMPSPGLPAYAAMLTGGQSVRGYFEQLLSARRPGTRPRSGELSLGSVFEDERAAGAASSVAPPDPSFDEFYADTAESSPLPPTDPPAADEPGGDDLEGFTDWLRGLRR